MRISFLLVSAACILAACSGSAEPATPYELILVPAVGGQPFATPFGMNAAGEVAGYAGPSAYHPDGFAVHVDASGAVEGLPGLAVPLGFAYSVSDAGLVCGESGRRACVWEEGVLHEMRVPAGVFSGSAQDATADGLVVGSYGDSDEIGPHHCFWPDRDADAVPLRGLTEGNLLGTAWAVNESGRIAGASGGFEGTFFPVRWGGVDAEPVRIGPLPGAVNGEARAINGRGDVAGRSSFADGSIRAFLHVRETDTLVALPFLPGGDGYSEAFGVNDDGDVVGTARAAGGVGHAVLWRSGEIHDLNDLVDLPHGVAYLSSAVAVADDGRIAAEAVLTDGQRRIAILTPRP